MDGCSGLRSRVVVRPWSEEEDDGLRRGVAKYGVIEQWKVIAAEFVPGRTNKACRKVVFSLFLFLFLSFSLSALRISLTLFITAVAALPRPYCKKVPLDCRRR